MMNSDAGIRHIIIRCVQLLVAVLVLYLMTSNGAVAEVRIGAGTGWLYRQPDILFTIRPENIRFAFGFRVAYYESDDSGYAYAYSSTDSSTYVGPVACCFFTPESPGSFYALAGLYRWTLDIEIAELGESDSVSSTALYLGGAARTGSNSGISLMSVWHSTPAASRLSKPA